MGGLAVRGRGWPGCPGAEVCTHCTDGGARRMLPARDWGKGARRVRAVWPPWPPGPMALRMGVAIAALGRRPWGPEVGRLGAGWARMGRVARVARTPGEGPRVEKGAGKTVTCRRTLVFLSWIALV